MENEELYRRLAEKIMMGNSTLIPLLFGEIASEEEAELMLALPGTSAEMTDGLGRDEREVQDMLDTLYLKGLVFKKAKPEGTQYRMCRDIMQFHDASILWPEAPRTYLDLWQRFMDEEWPTFAEAVDKMLPKPITRVVPVSESMDTRQKILAYEDVREMIDEAGVIAVTNCTCRLTAQRCDRPVEICLQIGKAGEYTIDRGSGRKIDKGEALALLRKAEEAGLVHVTMNRTADTHFICNCCNDCCMAFAIMMERKLSMVDPSRYVSRIDADLCAGCGDCLERCYFGALTMDEEAGVVVVDPEACMGCGLCQVVCSETAIVLEPVRESDFIPG
jgi:NAD-dependent dihydropyrimidine dehydrogenase PreA subunit